MRSVLDGIAAALSVPRRSMRRHGATRTSDESRDEPASPLPGAVPRRRRGRTALLVAALLLGSQVMLGAPAGAQLPGVEDCKEAPNPERPGAGMVGVFDPTPPGHGQPDSVYQQFGYAGQVWHNYDLGCGPTGLRNPNAVVDTWTGNQVFNFGKNLVAATNGLHYELLEGQLLEPMDDLVMAGSAALYNSVFSPLVALVAIILAVLLFRSIWRGDLATISKRTLWALAGLWFASITYLTPLIYAQALDEILIDGTAAIQTGFFGQVGVEERDELPTLLHETVVYNNWLRGQFGSPDSPDAEEHGEALVRAQAWSKDEVEAGEPPAQEKRDDYVELAEQFENDGRVYGYFRGVDGSRMGAGFLAAGQGLALALFQLLAKVAILLAQVLLRVLILIGPVVGLIAIVYPDVLRNVGKAIGAAVINVIVIAAMAGLHAFVLTALFDPARGIPALAQLLLATLITVVFLLICKPVRRMSQMVELSVNAIGGVLPANPPGVLSMFRRRRQQPSRQDEFWEQAKAGDDGLPAAAGEQRPRPEATPTVLVAERLDRNRPVHALPGGGNAGSPMVIEGGPVLSGPAQAGRPALPAGSGVPSRQVDSPPVVDTSWDRLAEREPVLVPSQARSNGSPPRRAELETVGGKPVWVVYRPSRGLEVRPW